MIKKKLIDKACDFVFESLNRFFSGTSYQSSTSVAGEGFEPGESIDLSVVEWDLHQDLTDILVNDIRKTFSWIVPAFIHRSTIRYKQSIYIYLNFDPAIATDEQDEKSNMNAFIGNDVKNNTRTLFVAEQVSFKVARSIISMKEWLLRSYKQIQLFLESQNKQPEYYLIGSFSPYSYESYQTDQPAKNRGPDHSKFSVPKIFHLRN